MGCSHWQTRVPGLVVVVCLVVLVFSEPTALALPGDDWGNSVPLTVGVSTPGTLTPQADLATNHVFVYSVALTAGQTLVATCSAAPTVSPLDVSFWASGFHADYGLGARAATSTCSLRVLAPRSGSYLLVVEGGSSTGTFTIDTAYVSAGDYSLSKLSVPKKASRKRAFQASVTLNGYFDQLDSPVRFKIQRKVHRKWKAYGSAKAVPTGGGDLTRVRYASKVKLHKGVFRIRARFTDAAHPQAIYDAWKTVSVK
jgi:hypothetical protein